MENKFQIVILALLILANALGIVILYNDTKPTEPTFGARGYVARVFPALSVSEDGSASAPSYTFVEDPDTGVYRKAANDIGFATAGALIFNCDSSGCTNAGTFASTGTATMTTLKIGANQFSGAIRGGAATTVADGGTITHTFASPPSWCTVSPYTIGMTATVATVTTTTLTINVNKTGNVYWSCGF